MFSDQTPNYFDEAARFIIQDLIDIFEDGYQG